MLQDRLRTGGKEDVRGQRPEEAAVQEVADDLPHLLERRRKRWLAEREKVQNNCTGVQYRYYAIKLYRGTIQYLYRTHFVPVQYNTFRLNHAEVQGVIFSNKYGRMVRDGLKMQSVSGHGSF